MNNEQGFDQSMIDAAMSIIVDAGDARLAVTECFKAIAEANFDGARAKLDEARKLLAKAHGKQTDIIQDECAGEMHQHPLLFIHAQDTLMTIKSEMDTCHHIMTICEGYEKRLNALEKE
jgi:Phosphotransferase system cellobiose-specific component IIA